MTSAYTPRKFQVVLQHQPKEDSQVFVLKPLAHEILMPKLRGLEEALRHSWVYMEAMKNEFKLHDVLSFHDVYSHMPKSLDNFVSGSPFLAYEIALLTMQKGEILATTALRKMNILSAEERVFVRYLYGNSEYGFDSQIIMMDEKNLWMPHSSLPKLGTYPGILRIFGHKLAQLQIGYELHMKFPNCGYITNDVIH